MYCAVMLMVISVSPVDQINSYREKQGRSALVVNDCLQKQAETHCLWMAKHGMSHTGYQQRLAHCGMSGSECIAMGGPPVQMWINSSPHRAIMLGNYKYCGVATINGWSCLLVGSKR